VTLKGDNPKLTQSIRLETLNRLLTNTTLLAEVNICSLRVLEVDGKSLSSQEGYLPVQHAEEFPLQTLLDTYHHVFKEPVGLPLVRGHDHRIPLKDENLIVNLRPYRYSGLQKDTLEKLVAEMLEAGIVQPSHSPFASPVVLVKKKDQTWWFCVDF